MGQFVVFLKRLAKLFRLLIVNFTIGNVEALDVGVNFEYFLEESEVRWTQIVLR